MAHEKAYQTTITYNITVSLILFFRFFFFFFLLLFMKFLLVLTTSTGSCSALHREIFLYRERDVSLTIVSLPHTTFTVVHRNKKMSHSNCLWCKNRKGNFTSSSTRFIFGHAVMVRHMYMCENEDVWKSWWGWTTSYIPLSENPLIRKIFLIFFFLSPALSADIHVHSLIYVSSSSCLFFSFRRQTLQWNENTSASGDAITII